MKRTIVTLAIALFATAASAAVTTPGQVKFKDGAVAVSLTGVAGNAEIGRNVFKNRKLGNCLACHTNSEMPDQQFHGEIGPSLDGVASRRTEAELRGLLVNSKNTYEGTIMPAFYRVDGFTRNMKKFQGKSILSAQEVEDVVAYLLTLK